MSDTTGSVYLLARGGSERDRLNAQQKTVRKCVYDDRILNDDTVLLQPGCRILDSATGSGAWLIDAAQEVPEGAELYGADISDKSFPPPNDVPSNAHFSVAPATALPHEWDGYFDVVHQRYVANALRASDWKTALSEFHRVLKPGGALQLVEIDFRYPTSVGPTMKKYEELQRSVRNSTGVPVDAASHLGAWAEEAGFVNVMAQKKYVPVSKKWGEIGQRGFDAHMGALRNLTQGYLKAGFIQSGEEYSALLDDVEKEWDEFGVRYTIWVVCARKP
ncbi:S-adenosyl-L-methionine-dependent methyltransferase [Schizopora paradoxa]|uniref:S-adenosyl-L-methionine-dependent methyltransferase n=1 Tax=Schizopora paradoxa TaxID=27342 RepID=A0A0H2RP11_9AGAM|nr:S-adenosyl-L-methionine-dependent methyltransferase [Schizopora paradoxa]